MMKTIIEKVKHQIRLWKFEREFYKEFKEYTDPFYVLVAGVLSFIIIAILTFVLLFPTFK